MLQVGIPTAAATWHTTPVSARAALREHGFPVVIKASGLAAGKGVIVAETMGEAEHAVDAIMVEGAFGAAGSEVLVEDFMRGEELSVFAVSDGANFVVLPTAQDHKRLLDGDRGPNTGGMGAYAPASLGSPSVLRTVSIEIIAPVLAAMRDIGSPFVGLLYVGIMLTEHGPKVVEFNCRFGDPESQAVLTSMRAPLLPLLLGGSEAGGLRSQGWATAYDHYAVTTVVAVAGYPEKPIIGAEVVIPTMGEGQLCFHAGTAVSPSGQLVATGGRVLSVTGVGRTVAEAKARSLAGAERVQVEGGQFRRDIAWRELKRSAGAS
jgi:phosphoribosylamine--glycine ligase